MGFKIPSKNYSPVFGAAGRNVAFGLAITSCLMSCGQGANLNLPGASHAATMVDDETVMAIIETHCTACHAANPVHVLYDEPQGDLSLESIEDVRGASDAIALQTVYSDLMPLGNETGMTEEERRILGKWIEQLSE